MTIFLKTLQNARQLRPIKSTLSGLRQLLATESPLKLMKMLCTLKALFITEINIFLFSVFSLVRKWLDKKAKMNFKIYDITKWITNS